MKKMFNFSDGIKYTHQPSVFRMTESLMDFLWIKLNATIIDAILQSLMIYLSRIVEESFFLS